MSTSSTKKDVSTSFKWFHATSVNGGAMAIAATIGSYFSIYAQEQIGITAASLSVVMLIASLWDAINDPMMGVICDNTKTRWGRYRFWFTFTPVLLLIFSILLFTNPGFESAGAKFAYVLIVYIGYGMTVTAYTMPQMAILPAATLNDGVRNDIIAKGAGVCALAFTIASTFTPQLVEIFGNYRNLMIIYGVLAILSFWGLFATGKEKYLIEKEKGESVFKQLSYVFRHKEVFPVMLTWCLASVSYGFMFSSSVYYAQYIYAPKRIAALNMAEIAEAEIGKVIGETVGGTISTYMGFVSMGALISMVFLMPLALKFFKTGYRAIIITQIATVICYVLLFFTGQMNFTYCCVLSFVATAVGAMVNALVNVLVNDTIDFIQLKEGKQMNGIISSVKGFAQKCGNTIVNSGMLAVLAMLGFDATLGLDQPASAMVGCNVVRFAIPAAVSAVIILLMVFYPLKKFFPEIAKMKEKMAAERVTAE